ncbi:glycosyltransferase family 4 protein [Methylomagnum sp.]
MAAEFYVDKLLSNSIMGWGWDPEVPEIRLGVSVYVNDEFVGKTICDKPRQDLKDADKGDGAYAMEFYFLESIDVNHDEVVIVSQEFGELFRYTPPRDKAVAKKVETKNLSRTTDNYKIHIELLSDKTVKGWCAKKDSATGEFSGAAKLIIRVNDLPAARVKADLPREDVHQAGWPLRCGFDISLPVALEGGDKIEICEGTKQNVLLATQYADISKLKSIDLVEAVEGAEISAPVPSSGQAEETHLFFDISDLVYYIGHHENLTGIQRVQSCVLLAIAKYSLHPSENVHYLSYDNRVNSFCVIDPYFFLQLLNDLGRPVEKRKYRFDKELAKLGYIEPSVPLEKYEIYSTKAKKVICMLGAAWVNRDYFKRVNDLKTEYGFHFVMTVHDLIPVYARETCDQGTSEVFQAFLRKSFRYVDGFLSVSENTARDIKKYARSISVDCPPIYVTQNGSSFNEFFQAESIKKASQLENYVLFVSTIEGRKNHQLIFRVWQELMGDGVDVPSVVCVGRLGWRANEFLQQLVSTRYLNGKFRILSDISDSELDMLYENAMFTVYPSLYEGWGLPVGESLVKGKVCVTTHNSSLPEVGGDFAVYIDSSDINSTKQAIRKLIEDSEYRLALEEKIHKDYQPIRWSDVSIRIIASALEISSQVKVSSGPVITLGKEYAIREISSGRDALGEEMLKVIQESRRGVLREGFLDDDSFYTGQEFRLGAGWHTPEHWGTWSTYPKARLSFLIEPESRCERGYVMYLKLSFLESLMSHSYKVSLNGAYLLSKNCETANARLVQIPIADIEPVDGKGGVYTLEFSFEKPSHETAEELRKTDPRCLGFGFIAMMVLAKDDTQGRLNVLEKLQFG